MATDISGWTNYWDTEDYDTWKKTGEDAWGDTKEASSLSSWIRDNYSWDSKDSALTTLGDLFSGGATGAVTGSVLGPVGTILGGLLGMLFGGLFGNSRKKEQEYNSYLDSIIYQSENLTLEYNRNLEDLKKERDRGLEELNTLNSRYQQLTERQIASRDSDQELAARQVYMQSQQNAEELKEMNKSLVKQTSKETAQLATSGFRNTGSVSSSIAYSFTEGQEKIQRTKEQMDLSIYTSNYQMAQNYINSTYQAYSYQNTIADNIIKYSQWLEDLETSLGRLSTDYERSQEEYIRALNELKSSKNADSVSSLLSGLSSSLSGSTSIIQNLINGGWLGVKATT